MKITRVPKKELDRFKAMAAIKIEKSVRENEQKRAESIREIWNIRFG